MRNLLFYGPQCANRERLGIFSIFLQLRYSFTLARE